MARRSPTPAVGVWLALVLVTGCHAHVAHPGRVRVVTYELEDRVELELDELRVDARHVYGAEDHHWVNASAVRQDGVCEPVLIRVSLDDGSAAEGPLALEPGGLRGVAAEGSPGWEVDPLDFATWTRDDEARIEIGPVELAIHDEHVFNLRNFADELACPTASVRTEP